MSYLLAQSSLLANFVTGGDGKEFEDLFCSSY
jgi:hypothetical protein